MTKIVTLLLAGTASFGLAAVAQAADMGGALRGPAVVQPVSEPAVSGGWYLRGDVGVSIASKPTLESDEPNVSKQFLYRDMTDSPSIALGVGYQFNDYLRGDITGEYHGSMRLRGIASYPSTYGTLPSTNYAQYDGHLRSLAIMANGYIDLGNFNGFTPYVGAGVGAVYHQTSDFYNESNFYVNNAGAVYPMVPERGVQPGAGKWDFAWALHTGMSWDISQNAKLDFGYSYKNLGTAVTNAQTCYSGTGCTDTLKIKNIGLHDLHAGIRWTIDPVTKKAPVYSAPVVAKY